MLRRRFASIAALVVLVTAALAPAATAASSPRGAAASVERAGAPPEAYTGVVAGDGFVRSTAGGLPPIEPHKPALEKADWRVASYVTETAAAGIASANVQADRRGLRVTDGGVRVILDTSDATAAAAAVRRVGAALERSSGNLLQITASATQLGELSAEPSVRYLRPPAHAVAESVTGQGIAVTNATAWHLRGRNGAGVKVAIIDLGFAGYRNAQASGDLPATLTTVDDCSGNFESATEHGTAVAEIVHEMAPGAALYLICVDTELDLAAAEQYAVDNGIAIVNHSVGWYDTSRGDGKGGTGTPDGIVADARSHGILWVNAAGNDAQTHWSGKFVNNGSGWNVFSGTDVLNRFSLAGGGTMCALLKWDNWPYSNQDFDLYIVRLSDQAYIASYNRQDGSAPPIEELCFQNTSSASEQYGIAIARYAATSTPRFDLFLLGAKPQYVVAAGSVAEPASSPNAFAVGAVCYAATTAEAYSSRGPTIDGRIKPDVAGPDRVSSFTYGTSTSCTSSAGFGGTSAASPHVAGAAALVKSAWPSSTAADLQSYLQSKVRDLGTAGRDNTYGYGEIALPTVNFAPLAPTGVTASAGNASVTVRWTAPNNGGSAITGYTVTSWPGGRTCSTNVTSCTLGALTNGTAYTFVVTAKNAIGTSAKSSPTTPVVPMGPPSAPAAVTAVAHDRSAAVSWSAPTNTGGSAITGYTVTSTPGGKTCSTPGALTCTVTGLANGTSYTFAATARNSAGTGAAGVSNAVIPATVPDAPANVVATPYNESASVAWTAPFDEGRAITGYTVTASPGGLGCTPVGVAPYVTRSCTVTGLTNGVSYTFTVTATNAIGTGPASAPSNAVVPIAVPDAPLYATATRGDRSADVVWPAPADNGSPIIDYTVSAYPGTPNPTWTPSATCTSTTLSCHVTGLVNGTSYQFAVAARNANGTSPQGALSAPITPAGLPGAPAIASVVGRDGAVDVAWAAANYNGDPITAYTVRTGSGSVVCTTAALSCTATGLTNRTSYTFTVQATNGVGTGPVSAASKSVVPLAGATYVPVTPSRLVDSRPNAKVGLSSALRNGVPASFQVTNRAAADAARNVPANATAVTGNLTVTSQTSKGYFSLTPAKPSGIPGTSTLNFPQSDTRANAVTVPLGAGGVLWVTFVGVTGATAHVVFDVTGYFVPNAAGATYVPLTPNRILDSRPAAKLGLSAALRNGAPVSFPVTGRSTDASKNVPPNAIAVTGNLTVTGQTSKGYFSLTPAKPSGIPSTSTLNFPLGDTRANAVTAPLGANGVLWVTFVGLAGATANVVFDVTGYFVPGATGATYVPLTPNRIVDSRSSARLGLTSALRSGVPAWFDVTGRSTNAAMNVPDTALAVTGNLTVTGQTSKGYFSLTPAKPSGIPSTSTLNFPLGDNRANAVAVRIGNGGVLWVTFVGTSGATANVVFDVTGYFRM